MKKIRVISWISLGALTMYFFDPRLGHRRRALLQGRISGTYRRASRWLGKTGRDIRHRLRGAAHRLGERVPSPDLMVSDSVLEARVRSRIGRHLNRHPHTFDVSVKNGEVTISGEMSDSIYQKIYPVLRAMSGVQRVQRGSRPPTAA